MRNFNLYFFAAALSFGLVTACDNSDDPVDPVSGYGDVTGIINDYVDKTVLPTYQDMKNKAWVLDDAVKELSEAGGFTNANITAACDAWRATRVPWEQSEAFLFGPATLQSLDPLLDSWPLDQGGIDQVLAGGSYIDPGALGETVRGFHTVEYFLFLDGEPRTTATFIPNSLEYLTVVTEVLRDDCIKLWSSWAGADALSGKDAEAMDDAEFEPASPSYASQFKNAGNAGSVYISPDEAIDAIVDGCMTISEEVGAQKIGGPNGMAATNPAQAVLEVESWYSWNSIDDYANNIISIRNSYFGSRGAVTPSVNSLSALVKSLDADLDKEITDAIDAAYKAIDEGMPYPFRNNLTGAEVDAAMDACAELTLSMEKVKSLKR